MKSMFSRPWGKKPPIDATAKVASLTKKNGELRRTLDGQADTIARLRDELHDIERGEPATLRIAIERVLSDPDLPKRLRTDIEFMLRGVVHPVDMARAAPPRRSTKP